MQTAHLSKSTCEEINQILGRFLADSYVLYVKTQNFHWNVQDPRFYQLHKLFEEQYEELAEALDVIAERIRMCGGKAPGALSHFLELSTLEEARNDLSGDQMLQQLAEDHTYLADFLRSSIAEVSALGDEGTADMMINRLRSHEKNAWMLRSHFEKSKKSPSTL